MAAAGVERDRARHNRVIFTRDLGGDLARERRRAGVESGPSSWLSFFARSLPFDRPSLSNDERARESSSPGSLCFSLALGRFLATLAATRGRRGKGNARREIRPPELFQCTDAFVISCQFVIQKRQDESPGQIASFCFVLPPSPPSSSSLAPFVFLHAAKTL